MICAPTPACRAGCATPRAPPTTDGNASFVLAAGELPTPNVDDPASVEAHRRAVDVKPLGDELCVTCHRGFLSPDLGLPIHLSGIDEPTAWRSSAWNGAGAGRVDKVDKQGCISCHMPEVAVGEDDYSGDGKARAHTFAGGPHLDGGHAARSGAARAHPRDAGRHRVDRRRGGDRAGRRRGRRAGHPGRALAPAGRRRPRWCRASAWPSTSSSAT
jgi:hypothetical protein